MPISDTILLEIVEGRRPIVDCTIAEIAEELYEKRRLDNEIETPRSGSPEFHKILDEMRELHERKAKDYSSGSDPLANVRQSVEFGIPAWVGVMIRCNDKMHRIKEFAKKGTLANESVEDLLLDNACYSILALILYREGKK